MVTHVVVASVPFLANIAQSAWSTTSTSSSASSTITAPGPFWQSPRARWSRDRGLDGRVAVAEHDRAVAAHEVDVLVAVDVPDAAALARGHELRERRRAAGSRSGGRTCRRGSRAFARARRLVVDVAGTGCRCSCHGGLLQGGCGHAGLLDDDVRRARGSGTRRRGRRRGRRAPAPPRRSDRSPSSTGCGTGSPTAGRSASGQLARRARCDGGAARRAGRGSAPPTAAPACTGGRSARTPRPPVPVSTIVPRYMTATRSLRWRTTDEVVGDEQEARGRARRGAARAAG